MDLKCIWKLDKLNAAEMSKASLLICCVCKIMQSNELFVIVPEYTLHLKIWILSIIETL